MREFGNFGNNSQSDVRVEEEDRLDCCMLCDIDGGLFLFADKLGDNIQPGEFECERIEVLEEACLDAEGSRRPPLSGEFNDTQLEDLEGDRVDVVEEARVEVPDNTGLPLSREFNGGNLLQL